MATTRSEMELRLLGYRTATTEVLYRMPDYPELLQSFTWQTLDLAPKFPRVRRFLDYWVAHIDAQLYSVTIASKALIQPAELHMVDGEFRLN